MRIRDQRDARLFQDRHRLLARSIVQAFKPCARNTIFRMPNVAQLSLSGWRALGTQGHHFKNGIQPGCRCVTQQVAEFDEVAHARRAARGADGVFAGRSV